MTSRNQDFPLEKKSKIQILSSLCGGLSKSFVLEPEMVVWESRELYLDHNVQAFKFNLWMLAIGLG